MALLSFAGAEDNTINDVTAVGNVIVTSDTKRSGNFCYRLNGSSSGFTNLIVMPFEDKGEIYFQVAINPIPFELYYSGEKLIEWRKGSTVLGCLVLSGSGSIELYLGNKTTLLASGSISFATDVWSVIEGHIILDNSSGVIEIRQNGATIVTYSGNTMPGSESTVNSIAIGNFSTLFSYNYTYVDDIIILDTNGAYLNSWPGGLKIIKAAIDGAGYYSEWIPSSGNNYECVNDVPPDNTDYVSTGSTGNKDTYTVGDVSNVAAIHAVVLRFWGEGAGYIKGVLRINGTDYIASEATQLTTAFGKVDKTYYVSPATGNKFTQSEINSAEIGMESA